MQLFMFLYFEHKLNVSAISFISYCFCLSLFTFSRTFQNLVEGVNETTNLYDIKCQWTRLTRELNPRALVFLNA